MSLKKGNGICQAEQHEEQRRKPQNGLGGPYSVKTVSSSRLVPSSVGSQHGYCVMNRLLRIESIGSFRIQLFGTIAIAQKMILNLNGVIVALYPGKDHPKNESKEVATVSDGLQRSSYSSKCF